MLKHRLSKICNVLRQTCCMLFVGGLALTACQDHFDEYKYDDEEPDWLGASIYDFLKTGNGEFTYNYYVRMIDSLGENEYLSRTGSKTLFVVDDASFDKWFESDKEGQWADVKKFEDLTKEQMRVIYYSSMLDNAYLLDMLGSPEGANYQEVTASCLRRATSAKAFYSVPYLTGLTKDGGDLPDNNSNWDYFIEKGGVRMALDGSDPMMVHFLPDVLKAQNITDEDMNLIFKSKNLTREGDEVFLYQSKVLASGINYDDYSDDTLTIICKNGYVYRMSDVLIPPSNMAEEIRKHSKTTLFSRMLDRFSTPFYDPTVGSDGLTFTGRYNSFYGVGSNNQGDNKVYERRYFNSWTTGGRDLYAVYLPDDVDLGSNTPFTQKTLSNEEQAAMSVLKYDPGWNQLTLGSSVEQDMGSMFVPTDEAVAQYFAGSPKTGEKTGSSPGRRLIEQFAPEVVQAAGGFEALMDYENNTYLADALDSIPTNILAKLVNNLMQKSFYKFVPSKFDKIVDDGYREMGITTENVEECVVANNGVIYILNNLFGPAIYESVAAPPTILSNMEIMNQLLVGLLYDSYLLAMDAEYSFIVPDDDYFVYYDPVTTNENVNSLVSSVKYPTVYKLRYDTGYTEASNATPKLWAAKYQFDPATYQIVEGDSTIEEGLGSQLAGTSEQSWMRNRGRELLENLIIVDNIEASGNKYFQTKGYGVIKCEITGAGTDAANVVFRGGEQLENGRSIALKENGRYDYSPELGGNGRTYCTYSTDPHYPTGIPTPTTKSVYDKMGAQEQFSDFFELCKTNISTELLKEMLGSYKRDSLVKYSIFVDRDGTNYGLSNMVPFFSKYHYTVYVPNNVAMAEAHAAGLPTWEEITELCEQGEAVKAASMMRMLNKFLRYHFQDNSLFIDENAFSGDYETAAIDNATGRFIKTTVESKAACGGMTVTDQLGNEIHVVTTDGGEGKSWNAMARDIILPCNVMGEPTAARIETSAFAVLHEVDEPLYSESVIGYDGFYRFTSTGETIDSMKVSGVGAEYDEEKKEIKNEYTTQFNVAGLSHGEYIVATKGIQNVNGKYKKVGYLMRRIAEPADRFTKEEFVLDELGNSILITNDGYRVKEGTYAYLDATGAETETPYMVTYDSSGAAVFTAVTEE